MNCLYMQIKSEFLNAFVTKCKTLNLYYYILKRKCDIYWPEAAREPVYYGDLVVELESESTLPDYVLRVMSIKLVSAL